MSRRLRAARSVLDDRGPAGDGHPVVAALQAPPSDDELRGYDAAVAAYRATIASRRTRWLLTRAIGTGAAGVAATMLLTGGVAAAAYSAHLPDPVQRVAHRLFGPLGVPEPAHHRAARHHVSLRVTAPVTGLEQPRPRATTHPHVVIRRAHVELTARVRVVPAGGSTTVDGTLRTPRHRRSDRLAVLLARRMDDPAWRRVATARTDADGSVAFHVRRLVVNTEFRLRIGTLPSNLVRVDARPVLATSVQCTSARDTCTVTVTATGGRPGERLLLRRTTGASTVTVATARLDGRGQAEFVVETHAAAPQTYHVMLPATRLHTAGSTDGLRLPPGSKAQEGSRPSRR